MKSAIMWVLMSSFNHGPYVPWIVYDSRADCEHYEAIFRPIDKKLDVPFDYMCIMVTHRDHKEETRND